MKRPMFSLAFIFVLFGTLLISCSKEGETETEPIKEDSNSTPSIANQTFEIPENSLNGTSVGTVVANDAENDKLYYGLTVESVDAFIIDRDTGELKVLDSKFLDYESNENLTIEVIVTDGNSQSSATITVNMQDENDGPLTNLQKKFISEFQQVVFGFGQMAKRKMSMELFLDGDFSDEESNTLLNILQEFNLLFSDGFEIVLVDTLAEADVHLIKSPVESIENIFPEIYSFANQGGYTAAWIPYSEDEGGPAGQIWLDDEFGIGLFRSSLNFMIGLGEASDEYCGNIPERSSMCFNPAPEFSSFDKAIIKVLYHPDIINGMTFVELKPIIEQLLLDGFVSIG